MRTLLALVSGTSDDFFRLDLGRGVLCESLAWLLGVDVLVLTLGDCGCAFAPFRRFILPVNCDLGFITRLYF